MTKSQYEREKLRLARSRELAMLASVRAQANPRYVRDAAAEILRRLVLRKLAIQDTLAPAERRRLYTLIDNFKEEPVPVYFGA
ncbi:MAG: hypothetical protein ACRD20_20555 [Terriglobales bacterium]